MQSWTTTTLHGITRRRRKRWGKYGQDFRQCHIKKGWKQQIIKKCQGFLLGVNLLVDNLGKMD